MEIVIYFLVALTVIALVGFCHVQNKELTLTRHALAFESLPVEFDGFTIVHLSDLHNKWFGKQQRRLIDMVRTAKPDIIVMTGDMVDGMFYHPERFIALVNGLRGVAPIYYVNGNHEWKTGEYATLREQLIERDVLVVDDRVETIVRNDLMIAIAGLGDYVHAGGAEHPKQYIHNTLGAIRQTIDERAFKILLVHRPEWLREYMEHHFSLIFSGHAHGGQWNWPIIGPIFAPGQGLFPKLVSGVHRRHGTEMVISRGIGNSGIAFQRLFNKPEVVVVVLHSVKK